MVFSLSGGSQCLKPILVQCRSSSFCSCAMMLGRNSFAKALSYGVNWRGWAGRLRQLGDVEARLRARRFRPNIETGQAIHGLVGVRNPDGWLRRLRKEKSWKTLRLKRPLPRGSEEKNKLLVAPGGFPASRRWQSYCCYGSSYSIQTAANRSREHQAAESQQFQYLSYAVFAYLYCNLTYLIEVSKDAKILNR